MKTRIARLLFALMLLVACGASRAQAPVTTPDGRPAAGVPGSPTSSPAASGVLPGTGATGIGSGREAPGGAAGAAQGTVTGPTANSPGPLIRDVEGARRRGADAGSDASSDAASTGGVPAGAAATLGAPLKKDVPYVPTPDNVVAAMLKLAGVRRDDVVYDLGCGDGRIVIAAARRYGARGVGIDIDPDRIAASVRNAKAAGVAGRVEFRRQNLFDADIRPASVVTLYLLPDVNKRLMPKLLAELKPGTRVVSHAFDMGDWRPDRTAEVDGTKLHLWTIPQRNPAAGR